MSNKTLCVLPLLEDRDYFYRLLLELSQVRFNKHILILTDDNSEEINKIEVELKNIDHSIMAIESQDKSVRAKIGLELAYEWGIDYVAIFNEGAEDGIEDFLKCLSSIQRNRYSLISNSRKPMDLSLGSFFNRVIYCLFSLRYLSRIRDLSGDSAYAIRTKDFLNKFQGINYLPDNQFFFLHLFLTAKMRNFNIKFLEEKKLNRKSFYKYNLNSFIYTIASFLRYALFNFYSIKVRSSLTHCISKDFPLHNSATEPFKTIDLFTVDSFVPSKRDKISDMSSSIEVDSTEVDMSEIDLSEADSPGIESKKISMDEAILMRDSAVELTHKYPQLKNQLTVNWCLTNICNYKCSYCPDILHNGSRRGVKLDVALSFVDKVASHYSEREIHFELTGGEVTYYKGFIELIKYIKSKGHFVAIISNGARKLSFWKDNIEYLDHIMFSFHSEQGDPQHFKDVIEYTSAHTSVHVNIMMKPENFESCHDLANSIAKVCAVSICLQPLLEGMDGKMFDYSSEQRLVLDNQVITRNSEIDIVESSYQPRGDLELYFKNRDYLHTNSAELIANGFNHWAGWSCHIGLETVCVDFEGRVFRGWCYVGGFFGNIEDEQINFPTKPILCNKSQCSCGNDIMTSKSFFTDALI